MSFHRIMSFSLHAYQFVTARYKSGISFFHRTVSDTLCAFHLKPYQCENLNDIVYRLDLYHLRGYPLGDNVWIYKDNNDIQLVNLTTNRYFLFRPSSWHTYKRRVHPQVMSLLRHGKRENHQHYACHARQYGARSRKTSSSIRRKAIYAVGPRCCYYV